MPWCSSTRGSSSAWAPFSCARAARRETAHGARPGVAVPDGRAASRRGVRRRPRGRRHRDGRWASPRSSRPSWRGSAAPPRTCCGRAAALLGAQAGSVLAAPVPRRTSRRPALFGPIALYGLCWATLALPLARRALRDETWAGAARGAADSRGLDVGAGGPHRPAPVGVAYIHAIHFRPAFVGPFLLGLALLRPRPGGPEGGPPGPRRPALARAGVVARLPPLRQRGPLASPLRLALLGVAMTWAYLGGATASAGWPLLALTGSAALLVGASPAWLTDAFGRVLGSSPARAAGRLRLGRADRDRCVRPARGGARRSFVPRA